jgi:2,4-dienoyl-CoA reductase-like NADH-dependent reductase (Old Yellow Enzyme family)/NADPH-dependent 2,4-dienoyl-CoA reductase/sulfur reductase-like enzyme
MKYPHLFQPLRLGPLTLKNRLAMSQMTMNYATQEGFCTDRMIHYYRERARGGVGTIFVEGTFFTPEGRGYVNQLGIRSPAHVEKLKPLADALHQLDNGVKVFLQIQHAGGRASSKVTGLQPVAPSAIPPYPGAETPRALTLDEIQRLIEAHVEAAAAVRDAGFDGVDIHCAHGYLIPAFLSPLSNRREDAYGGDLPGRTRFLLEVIRGIKARLGRSYPLTIKISGDEYIEGGLRTGPMTEIACLAQEAGIACLVPIAAEIKESLRIPVVTLGRISQPGLAESVIAQGQADLIAMARPLLADPYFPQKVFEGKEEEIRPCIACNEGCYKRILQQLDVLCSVNPQLGREGEVGTSKALPSKRVVIVGGGPAGLEAAHRAWERGHEVTLVEKEPSPGGQLNLASLPPGRKEIDRFTRYLLSRLGRTSVHVISAKGATAALVKELRADTVVLTTGAHPRSLEIQGLPPSRSLTAWDLLAKSEIPGGSYLVLGGGLVGCETADFLSERGRPVTLVEILPEIAAGTDGDTKAYFTLRFQQNRVSVYTEAEVLRVEDRTIWIQQGQKKVRVEADWLVLAVGAQPNNGLEKELASLGIPVVRAGDCIKPRRLLDAVREGFDEANRL